jgi:hypothetical protein
MPPSVKLKAATVPPAGELFQNEIDIDGVDSFRMCGGHSHTWGDAMKLPRRLHLAAASAVLPVVSTAALALDYPTRPVHLVVGFASGGTPDLNARLVGQWLSQR